MQQKVGMVIPCFNEAERLNLSAIKRHFEKCENDLTILFVNDGSSDNTGNILEGFCRDYHDNVAQCISLSKNRGKAEAVRFGIKHLLNEGIYDSIGYWDADLATPLEILDGFMAIMHQHPHVVSVIGSRVKLCGRKIIRNPFRHYISRVFMTLLNVLMNIPVYDTQCGAKLFRTKSLIGNIDRKFCSRWLFDIELLMRIRKKRNADICSWLYEYPLDEWVEIQGSKVTWKTFVAAFFDMVRIYIRYRCNSI